MKKTSTMAFVLISVPLVSAALTAGTRYAWDNWTSVPMLECPRYLDLGEQKRGGVVIGRFQIKNVGKNVLQLGDWHESNAADRRASSCRTLPRGRMVHHELGAGCMALR
jgi:hypothetical protein